MGHALNKSIKDFITRLYAMRGYYTPYVPGWDNHGMPIESAIIKQNKLNRKEMSIPEFRVGLPGIRPALYRRADEGLPAHGRAWATGSIPTRP